MLRDEVLQDLKNLKPELFVSRHIFDRCPAAFDDRSSFIDWKDKLAQGIDVDPASITLVGSAAIGISLNPNKNFKLYDDKSDIDVAVVSSYHFNIAWRYLRTNYKKRYKIPEKQRVSWDEHVNKLIYWGTIATDKILPLMPFAKDWSAASNAASASKYIAYRSVGFRIYNDYESLRSYQVQSVRALRSSIDSTSAVV